MKDPAAGRGASEHGRYKYYIGIHYMFPAWGYSVHLSLESTSGTSLAVPRSPCASDAAVARQDYAHSTQATQQSCPFTVACVCSAFGTSARHGAPQQAEPRRASLACAAAVRHEAALGRAVARSACPSRSPYAQPLCPRCWAELGTALGRHMHACAVVIARNVKSREPPPPRRGPSREKNRDRYTCPTLGGEG